MSNIKHKINQIMAMQPIIGKVKLTLENDEYHKEYCVNFKGCAECREHYQSGTACPYEVVEDTLEELALLQQVIHNLDNKFDTIQQIFLADIGGN